MSKRKHSGELSPDSKIRSLEGELEKYKKAMQEMIYDPESSDNGNDDELSDESNSVADKENTGLQAKSLQDTEEIDEIDKKELKLDARSLKLLGGTSSVKEKQYYFPPELAKCWSDIIINGMERTTKSELLQKYPREGNCSLCTPELNPELLPLVNKTSKTRDKYLAANQDLVGSGLVALGKALTMIFNDEEESVDREELLEVLCDSSRYLCELMGQLSKTRKVYLYPSVDEKHKELLQNSVTDKFLFGADLAKRIKTATVIDKIGQSLKPGTEKKTPQKSRPLNWKNSSATRQTSTPASYKPGYQYRGNNRQRSATRESSSGTRGRSKPLAEQSRDTK